MSSSSLGQYFRSFIVKLSMIESQLGPLSTGNDVSFAIVLELQEGRAPSASQGKDPPPWMPAVSQHTTPGASDNAEFHFLRAVDTGIINLSLAVQESEEKLRKDRITEVSDSGKGKERAE